MPAAVYFRLNKPYNKDKSLKTTPVSVLLSYYNNGLEVELSTGFKVIPKQFTGTRLTKEAPRAAKINKVLSDRENQLLNLTIDHPGITIEDEEQIARAIIKGEVAAPLQKKTALLQEVVRQFIAQYSTEKDPATVARYIALQNKLQGFNPSITIDQLDFRFYDSFKNWLYEQPNPLYPNSRLEFDADSGVYLIVPSDGTGKKVGLFDEMVFKYFILLKTVLSWGEKRGHTPHHSYKEWEIIRREYEPITFTFDELKRIEALNLPGHLQLAQDVISLECRVGQRISDIKKIQPHEVTDNVWTLTQKKGNRLKTNTLSIPLVGYSAPALLILQKYNFQLPKINESDLNRDIRTVAMMAKVDQDFFIDRWVGSKKVRITGKKYEFVSSHTCKKSCITILAELGVPVRIISELTGTTIRTIERHYLGKSSIGALNGYLTKAEENQAIMRKAQ